MMRSLSVALLLIAAMTKAAAQDSKLVNVTTFSNRAVSFVATHTSRNPGAFVPGTEVALSRAGQWSARRYAAAGCASEAFGCVAVLYTTPDKDITCEWTVQIDPDSPSKDTIVALNANAANYLLLRASAAQATKLAEGHSLPEAVYPVLYRGLHLIGSVLVLITVDTTGRVATARALSGPALLSSAAVEAAKNATLGSLRVGGKALSWYAYAEYRFALSGQVGMPTFIDSGPPQSHKMQSP